VISWLVKGVTNTGIGTNLLPYWNGTAQNARNGASKAFTGLFVGTGANGSYYWKGYIAEVAIYNNVLSTGDRQKIEGYLAWKWGLQGNLPAGHPYKTISP
jgi:hexokinase